MKNPHFFIIYDLPGFFWIRRIYASVSKSTPNLYINTEFKHQYCQYHEDFKITLPHDVQALDPTITLNEQIYAFSLKSDLIIRLDTNTK